MDDRLKERALKNASEIVERDENPRKFNFVLPQDRGSVEEKLLTSYIAEVRRRDRDFLMDNATVSKVERVVKWMYDSRKRGLILSGSYGNGKTTMLLALKKLMGNYALYMETQTLYDLYRDDHNFHKYDKVVFLLDDLGLEPSSYSDFGEKRYPLTELLMHRYKYNLPTIIATNHSMESLKQTYGDRLFDRLKEMYAVISYTEQSYRK